MAVSVPLFPNITFDPQTGAILGAGVVENERRMGQLAPIFRDRAAARALPPDRLVYRFHCWFPVAENTPGGLFWGSTRIEPGMAGDEYFMTRGHFHARRHCGEFYFTVAGSGALVLMDEDRNTRYEPMSPQSIHYVPGGVAHRVANTGTEPLIFLACWPSEAGHDYESIEARGFSARMRQVDGRPTLVGEEPR